MNDAEPQTLNADDATLLLHVAGELDAPERHALEARLACDAGLRDRFAAMSSIDALMRSEATFKPVAVAESRRALSNSLRLVREQALLMQNRPAVAIRTRRLAGIPRWAWGAAAAACFAVGLLVWVSNTDPTPPRGDSKLADNRDRGFGREMWGVTAAFDSIEAPSSDEVSPSSTRNEIDTQINALDTLAAMNETN